MLALALPLLALACPARPAAAAADDPPPRPNVLFLAVDDLRPELNCYGAERIHSPNIDRLAASGVRFERAYCMVPTCGASRAALFTGLRPTRDRFVNYLTWAERDAPDAVPLHTRLRQHGYRTRSLGKVLHHRDDHLAGWDERPWRPRAGHYRLPENVALAARGGKLRGPSTEAADVPDDAYADGQIARRAIDTLGELAGGEEPFFLAVGFLKPHLPFVAPQKYWDLYPPGSIHLPATYHRPENAPDAAIHDFGELRSYHGIPPKGPVSDEQALRLIRGYHACVSYTDAQIGKVLGELDRLGLAENTVVVLWGDHGWNLGEHTLWCKHACFETSMRIPLIVRAPGVTPASGVSDGLTETIDLYPTLCELTGTPTPDHLAGVSLVPRLADPSAPGKPHAVGRYVSGDTIRTDSHRFTEYTGAGGKAYARMLYDHRVDPAEDRNVAGAEQDAVERHLGQLNAVAGDRAVRAGKRR